LVAKLPDTKLPLGIFITVADITQLYVCKQCNPEFQSYFNALLNLKLYPEVGAIISSGK
jgi:hypothetical protein